MGGNVLGSLGRLLEYIENRIDPDHCLQVDDLYKRSLNYEYVDKPPLSVSCEEAEAGFKAYPYGESIKDPAKMMYNQLVARVLPGIELACDNPLSIRVDFGVVILASIIGAKWLIKEDYCPWVEPLPDYATIDALLCEERVVLTNGLGSQVLAFMEFFNRKLAEYPNCHKWVQVEFPGPQCPFNVLHLLWGMDVYSDCYDNRSMVAKLMGRLTEVTIDHVRQIKPLTTDRQGPDLTCQQGYMVPGNVLIRSDSAVMVGPELYGNLIRPYHEKLLDTLGGGAIHFCGNGQHLIDPMLELRTLKGFDLGQHELMDTVKIYRKCAERGISITGLRPSADDLLTGRAQSLYPTGATFTFEAKTWAEAKEATGRWYRKRRRWVGLS